MATHPDGSPTQDTIDIQCSLNIRRLTVRVGFRCPLASYLKYLLSCLSTPNIQQITLFMLRSSEETNWQGWNEVDDVLAGVKFGSLWEVTIVISYWHDLDRIRQDLMEQFPSMYARGILNIRKTN